MKKIVLTATVLAGLAGVMAAWSQGGRPGQFEGRPPGGQFGMGRPMMMSCPAMAVRPPRERMVDRMAETLQLTKPQISKLKKIVAANEKKMTSLRRASEKATQALHASVMKPKYSAKTTRDLSAKAEKAEAAVVTASIDMWTQIRAVLTAKQSANLAKAMEMPRFGPGGPTPGAPRFAPPTPPKPKGAK